jgi:hypothetical protein
MANLEYIVTQHAMKVINLAQVKALASLDGWAANGKPTRIQVSHDYDSNKEPGSYLYCQVQHEKQSPPFSYETTYVIGIAPDGSMHS